MSPPFGYLRAVPPRTVLRFVGDHFGLTVDQVIGPRRSRDIVHARWMAVRMMDRQGRSLPAIGRIVNCNHTTVLYAIGRICDRAKTDDRIAALIAVADAAITRLADEEHDRRARARATFSSPIPNTFPGIHADACSSSTQDQIMRLRQRQWSDRGISRHLGVDLVQVQKTIRYFEAETV